MEYFAFIVIILIAATGYITSIKKRRVAAPILRRLRSNSNHTE